MNRAQHILQGLIPTTERGISALIVVFIFCSLAFTPEEKYEGNKIRSIMIDAGHGGHDPGNLGTGRYKITEKTIALEVAKKFGEKVSESMPDVKVLYTRADDRFHELHHRTKMANRAGVDLFVSVHCDAFTKESAHGCGSYVMGPAKSAANMKTAQKENAAMLKEKDYEKNYGGFDPYSPESYIELNLRQNAFQMQSLSFSDKVQDHFRDDLGRTDRGVKQAPFWVISHTTMPSALIELGFLTNKKEEDYLQSEKGKEEMSTAIFKAFRDYKIEIEGLSYNELETEEKETVIQETGDKETAVVNHIEFDAPQEAEDDNIYYKVQIATSSTPVDILADNFKGLEGVDHYISNGLYKYTYGKERKYKKARALQAKAREIGYEGCFVIAMQNGERIDLIKAIDKTGK